MFTAENIITIQGIQQFITNVQSTTNNWGNSTELLVLVNH